MARNKRYYVYILASLSGTLYIGITSKAAEGMAAGERAPTFSKGFWRQMKRASHLIALPTPAIACWVSSARSIDCWRCSLVHSTIHELSTAPGAIARRVTSSDQILTQEYQQQGVYLQYQQHEAQPSCLQEFRPAHRERHLLRSNFVLDIGDDFPGSRPAFALELRGRNVYAKFL